QVEGFAVLFGVLAVRSRHKNSGKGNQARVVNPGHVMQAFARCQGWIVLKSLKTALGNGIISMQAFARFLTAWAFFAIKSAYCDPGSP
ncbi:MAG: hypothetical protein WC810_20075, partial [Janthinobacterium sp.]